MVPLLQAGGIDALVRIINAAPAKSAHPLASCVGQMAAAVALQHILMRLPVLSESIVKVRLGKGNHSLPGCQSCKRPLEGGSSAGDSTLDPDAHRGASCRDSSS